ncbi:MAG: hypothetical protein Homavirus7_2 [Homavirus sp.]|uniref:Uncharacterized protein n=1 Tax=Homavirus sp. TaxID=2487769 RepID=A0A3G5A4D2_9VIRU|nr:MAG: hypothetical protein Homavirus7_2 [Homavirus sp.]
MFRHLLTRIQHIRPIQPIEVIQSIVTKQKISPLSTHTISSYPYSANLYLTKRYYSTPSDFTKATPPDFTKATPPDFTKPKRNLMDDFNEIYNVPYVKEWREMMDEMEKRKFNTKRLKIILCVLAGSVMFVSYDVIQKWTSEQVTHITTKSLEDPNFQKDVIAFCENIVNQLVTSEKIQNDVINLLQLAIFELAKRQDVIDELSKLFGTVFTSEVVQNAGSNLSAEVVKMLLHGEEYEELRQMLFNYLCMEINKLSQDDRVQSDIGILARNAVGVMIWGSSVKSSN